ncbi:MAG: hypothetical protein GY714_23975, partial [Desulfobacterales bacterium]|nr:hypothetical protein [Desulfobacterales bacterium]
LTPPSRKRLAPLVLPSPSDSDEPDEKKKKESSSKTVQTDEILQKPAAELQTDPEKVDAQVKEVYTEILLRHIFSKAKEYCEKCSTTEIYSKSINTTGQRQDCMIHNAFRFLSFHVSYVKRDVINWL